MSYENDMHEIFRKTASSVYVCVDNDCTDKTRKNNRDLCRSYQENGSIRDGFFQLDDKS
jgi:hypothetical protein